MPDPNIKGRPTSRPGLRGSSTSPVPSESGWGRELPDTRNRAVLHTSPNRRKVERKPESGDDYSDDDAVDEPDRSTHRLVHQSPLGQSPRLYPLLPDDQDGTPTRSPTSKSELGSPDDSFGSTKSCCYSRTGPRSAKKEPVTPAKGSPGKSIYPKLSEDIPEHHHRGASPVLVIFIFTMVIIGCLLLHHKLMDEEIKSIPKSQLKPIQEVYNDLKMYLRILNSAVTQPKEVWIQLIGQLGSVMVEEPQQPAVLLIVVPQDSKGTAVCLVHKFVEAIRDAFEDQKYVLYDVRSSRLADARTLKLELDEALQGLKSAHAAVLHNIEEVPGQAAMIFHAYCDNENAPFKQAVIFPILEVPGHYDKVANSHLDELVSGRLMKLWGAQLHEKDVSAIVSRIANAPILIKPEERATINKICPPV